MRRYDSYRIESPRTGMGSIIGFLLVVMATLGAFVLFGMEKKPRLAQTAFLGSYAVTAASAQEEVPAPAPVAEPEPVKQRVVAMSEPAAPLCDIAACERAYRSFRASDCTFQPYDGPRKLCTR